MDLITPEMPQEITKQTFSVEELIGVLKSLPPKSLVCCADGPVNYIASEPGANEPFVHFGRK